MRAFKIKFSHSSGSDHRDDEFEMIFQRMLSEYPAIFHTTGAKRETGFKFMIIFNAVYILMQIIFHASEPSLILPRIGVLLAAGFLSYICFDREKRLALALVGACASVILLYKGNPFEIVFVALYILWVFICFYINESAFKKAQKKSDEIYRRNFERTIQEHRSSLNPAMYNEEYSLPEIRFCPTCGFSLMEGEEVCSRCNPPQEKTDEENEESGS